MKTAKFWFLRASGFFVVWTICATLGHSRAEGGLHWREEKKEPMRVRLVALAWSHPHTSFFANEEVFIATKQLGRDESRLVKLVYGFLPYQPPLSEYGLDYETVHELRASRDPECDETLAQMMSAAGAEKSQRADGVQTALKYSTSAPVLNPNHRRSTLPCYVTTAEEYAKPVHEPTNSQENF